ncbi:MAG TPA: HD domain-containing protein [Candidatus Eisenbacteria bacterium]|nr:HD domain-containing protein [Candidatus Eisenbacteria bacterium]
MSSPLDEVRPDSSVRIAVPPSVQSLLDRLWANGHSAYVVGGSIRDALIGREAADWDLATDARPERLLDLFPGSVYENRFGTVAVRAGRTIHEITTFRTDHEYADFRRPHRVEFGDSILLDLARRDFTVNALAWGAEAPATGGEPPRPGLVDPFGGAADINARIIRAVGDPLVRFEEDALRTIRAIRLAAALGFEIEPATLAAIRDRASLVAHLSAERLAAEVEKLLAAPKPSIGLRLLQEVGILEIVAPELAAQRGIPQNKIEGEDLWDHTVRTVDAAPAGRPVARLAALLHDIGKPMTLDEGPFRGHEALGEDLATALLERLRMPRAVVERIARLVRHHMFTSEPDMTDAAIRRFIRRVGADALEDLFALREADNVGSGQPADANGLAELRARIDEQLAADVALDLRHLAVSGDDLISELGLSPGPRLGRILGELLDKVIVDPALNDRPTLLLLAEAMLADDG